VTFILFRLVTRESPLSQSFSVTLCYIGGPCLLDDVTVLLSGPVVYKQASGCRILMIHTGWSGGVWSNLHRGLSVGVSHWFPMVFCKTGQL